MVLNTRYPLGPAGPPTGPATMPPTYTVPGLSGSIARASKLKPTWNSPTGSPSFTVIQLSAPFVVLATPNPDPASAATYTVLGLAGSITRAFRNKSGRKPRPLFI